MHTLGSRAALEHWRLTGHQTKMSASIASTALYMTDTEKMLDSVIDSGHRVFFLGHRSTVRPFEIV